VFRLLNELGNPDHAERARRNLETLLQHLGRGAIIELASSLDVTRQTLHKWRTGGLPLTPKAVADIAACYTADHPADASVELFEAFYDPNPEAAWNWVREHPTP
jgi:hypothetical protein